MTTVDLCGLLPPSLPVRPLLVTWTRSSDGRVVLRAERVGGGYSWDLESLRGTDKVILPGGLGISGIAAALEAFDRGDVPEWDKTIARSGGYHLP